MRGVHVRLAEPADLDLVTPVLRSIRVDSPLGLQLVDPDADLRGHLRAWYTQPHTRTVVAESQGEIIGVALAEVIEPNLFSDVTYLQMEAMYVLTAFRRRGTGRALMSQVAVVAARAGADHVVTMPTSGSRSEQRFLAGLGFTGVGSRRMTPTAALLRRLDHPKGRERRGRGLDELIARRRRSRGLPPTPPGGVSLRELADRAEESGSRPHLVPGAHHVTDY